ncbi:ESPR domain-containing protein [uncultured Duodenibacillus sp.]|uniref:ESPR domain-containing protein n=1 Tax=uncultured Duodenibacillus sp. TaxID=1980699 RepID=UPI00280445D5|nr:ESPR domain-containing protein [uncultured Duodenibacillus sp.]
MNKTFKVVFNKARGMLMVVNESTSSVQKKPGTTWLTAAVMASFMAAPAFAEDVVRTVIEEDTALVSSSANDVYYDVNVGTISKTEKIGTNQSTVGSTKGNHRIDLKANVDSLEIVSRENMGGGKPL